jgi:hypothetical protein
MSNKTSNKKSTLVEKKEDDKDILTKIDMILNPGSAKAIANKNLHDGDELIALYQLNQAKKNKDSQTYRSRANRGIHKNYNYLKEELEEESHKHGWWNVDYNPITDD